MINKLNTQQEKALLEVNKPVLILAGAGSGKTRVITHKIAHLIKDHGYPPWSILAVTFTNKAAGEMRERIIELLDLNKDDGFANHINSLWVNTFHSVCAKILRREIDKIGYKKNFTIYDGSDSKQVIKDVIKVKKLECPTDNLYNISSQISFSKNAFESPHDVIRRGEEEGNLFIKLIGQIYKYYEEQLLENNALDFDDLLLKTIVLFEKVPDRAAYYQGLFRYIMVDEFQDTNHCQYRLIKILANGRSCISVVGDDDQSIYSWRGADISNIINFEKDFKGCKVIKLEQNYRSTNTILNAAHSVVLHNRNRLDKKLWSSKGTGDSIKYYGAGDDRAEGEWIINNIVRLYESTNTYKDIAVFYRMNYQSRIFEEYLLQSNIPYKIFGAVKFYDRMEIKDTLAYLTILANESDSLALKRIINVPKRGIGSTTITKIDIMSSELGLSFEGSALYCIDNKMIRNPIKDKLVDFFKLISELKQGKADKSVPDLLDYVLDKTGYDSYLKQNYENYEERLDNIDELRRSMLQYEQDQPEPTLDHYLMELSLKSDIDDFDESANYVSLMTLHNSKGLEFSNIFISGLDEGIFPHYMALDNHKEMEEERRLFYVGITRAKERCFLSSSSQRYSFGQMKLYKSSRFISEVHPDYIEKDSYIFTDDQHLDGDSNTFDKVKAKLDKHSKTKVDSNQANRVTNINEVDIGQTLVHKSFGKGVVVELSNKGDLSTVLLKFNGKKRLLLLKYAPLYKVD